VRAINAPTLVEGFLISRPETTYLLQSRRHGSTHFVMFASINVKLKVNARVEDFLMHGESPGHLRQNEETPVCICFSNQQAIPGTSISISRSSSLKRTAR